MKATEQLFSWLTRLLLGLAARTCPMICGDLNGRVGKVKENGSWKVPESRSIGPHGAEVENAQGKLIRYLCDSHALDVLNTHAGTAAGKT